jgi:hypothetical protein
MSEVVPDDAETIKQLLESMVSLMRHGIACSLLFRMIYSLWSPTLPTD